MNDLQRDDTNVVSTERRNEEVVNRRGEPKEEHSEAYEMTDYLEGNNMNNDSLKMDSLFIEEQIQQRSSYNRVFFNTPIVAAENGTEPLGGRNTRRQEENERRQEENERRQEENERRQEENNGNTEIENRSNENVCNSNNSNQMNASFDEPTPMEDATFNTSSNSPTRDYYILTITNVRTSNQDVFTDSVIQDEMINEEEARSIYIKPKFLTKFFGYKIKQDFEENNPNKKIRMVVFLLFLFFLFLIESYLLYHNASRLKIDSKFVLMESQLNHPFVASFLQFFEKEELDLSIMKEENIIQEINNGNYILQDRMCGILSSLGIPCNYNDSVVDPVTEEEGQKTKENLLKSAVKSFNKLKENGITIYKIQEKNSAKCNMISKKFLENTTDPIFLFSRKNKDVTLNFCFIFFTMIFLCIRMILITSQILFQFYIIVAYRGYCLSLKSKKSYLLKYICSISTILVLEIIIGPECIVWWIHNIEPRYIYHVQYFIWALTIQCYICYLLSKTIKKYKIRNMSVNQLNQQRLQSERFPYGVLEYGLRGAYSILFGLILICTSVFIISSVHKSTIIVAIVTIVTLLIDILNNLYFRQLTYHVRAVEISDFNLPKKFFILENKRANDNTEMIKMHRINEHMYRELSQNELQPIQQVVEENSYTEPEENKSSSIITEETNQIKVKVTKKQKKKCNKCKGDSCLKKCLHKKELRGSQSSINPYVTSNSKSEIIPEFCEICDEKFRNIILFPCMHGGFCEECIRSLISNALDSKNDLPHCPFCRNVIQHVYKIVKIYNLNKNNTTNNNNNEKELHEMNNNQIVDVLKIISIEIQ